MGLENRLKDLALYYSLPLDTVIQRYEGRYHALKLAYGHDYVGRDSHLRVYAFKGTAIALEHASTKGNKNT
jgi:hypothetical protein